jgi:hypothetical protein
MASCAAGLFLSSCVAPALAQQRQQAQPQLVTFWGVATNRDGKAKTGTAGVTFALYKEEQSGAPLWMETQNVALDAAGGYTAQIGATHPEGLPIGLFASGQARWLEVQVDGQPAEQRVLLVSVPYALKAVDAQTLGGLPASAFALAGTAESAAGGASIASVRAVTAAGSVKPNAAPAATVTGAGTAGYVPLWSSGSALGDSLIAQKSGDLGIGGMVSGFKLAVSNASDNGILGTTASSSGVGVQGQVTATSGNAFGVFGTTATPTGAGVEGSSTSTSGTAVGVLGTTASTAGDGVLGQAQATTGATFGVGGINQSSAGVGVQGHAEATTGDTVGVNGISDSGTGVGAQGLATATTGTTYGVVGESDSPAGVGVNGNATATTGTANGVYGTSASSSGVGVTGAALATSGNTFGVFGTAASPTGVGVEGSNSSTSGSGPAVLGTTASTSGIAVKGQATATAGATYAVYGKNASSTGIGVQGVATATTGIDYGVGGTSASTQGVGVYGYGATQSTLGGQLAGNAAGVWGDTHNGSAGVMATADSAEAIAAYNNSSTLATLFVENQEDANSSAIVVATYSDYGGYCDIFVNGNLVCSGSVGGHASVPEGADGSRDVALYAVQAPENWFEDAGSGQLYNGTAVVVLDSEYAQTVNTGMDYHVFLTPNGDCKGLYVSQKSPTSFDVHELGGGSSNIAFDYRIMAKRKGYENIRLADLTNKIQRGTNSKTRSGALPERVLPGAVADVVQLPTALPQAHVVNLSPRAAQPTQSRARKQTSDPR